jgi:hypothetical protein
MAAASLAVVEAVRNVATVTAVALIVERLASADELLHLSVAAHTSTRSNEDAATIDEADIPFS